MSSCVPFLSAISGTTVTSYVTVTSVASQTLIWRVSEVVRLVRYETTKVAVILPVRGEPMSRAWVPAGFRG